MRMWSRWPLSLKTTNADKQIPPSGISRVCSGRSVGAKRQNLRSVGMPIEPRPALFNLAARLDSRFRRSRLETVANLLFVAPAITVIFMPPFAHGPSGESDVKTRKQDRVRDRRERARLGHLCEGLPAARD